MIFAATLCSVLAQADGGHDFPVSAGESHLGGVVALPETVARGDGGLDSIYSTCPAAPPLQAIDGGWVMLFPRAARNACLFETCEADRSRRAAEKAESPPPTQWVVWATGIVMAASAGFSLGKALK